MELPLYSVTGLTPQLKPDIPSLHRLYAEHARAHTPIVIDNGSYNLRAGWAGDAAPLLNFRNVVARQKNSNEEILHLVGSEIPDVDLQRLSLKSPFERNIVQHFHTQEYVLDYVFSAFGVREATVPHPLFVTEAVSNPNYCRGRFLELAFECYGVPAVSFGVDGLLSWRLNYPETREALIVNYGHSTTHVLPVVDSHLVANFSRRINIGGSTVTDSLMKTLQTRYFYNRGMMTWPLAQEIILKHCFTATDYSQDLHSLKTKGQLRLQLPWTAPVQPSDDELKRRQQQRKDQGQRLRELMAKKRTERKKVVEDELGQLMHIENIRKSSPAEFQDALVARGLGNLEQLKRRIQVLMMKLNMELKPEKFDLIDIPDEELSQEQLREKLKQRKLKGAHDARMAKKAKEQEDRDRMERLRNEDPENFLRDLVKNRHELVERIELRKRKKLEQANRQTRTNRGRLKIIAELGREDEGEDNFGVNDQDWEIYKEIQRDSVEEEDEDTTALGELDLEISKLDPNHVIEGGQAWRQLTAEDYQIYIEVDRVRPCEIIFQPSLVGSDQMGLAQTIEQVLACFPVETASRLADCVFLTGGCSNFNGFRERIVNEMQAMRPFGSSFNVVGAKDCMLDAWRGASQFASSPEFRASCVTKEDFMEAGVDCMKEVHDHPASNAYGAMPTLSGQPAKRSRRY
jgi:actin-related protein 5